MAKPYINPIGFIDRTTDNRTIFLLNNPEDSRGLKLDAPVTVWRYSPDQLALAKIRGVISTVGYVTATFRIVESAIDPRWPEDEEGPPRESPPSTWPWKALLNRTLGVCLPGSTPMRFRAFPPSCQGRRDIGPLGRRDRVPLM